MAKFIAPMTMPASNGKTSFHNTFWTWMTRCQTGLGSFSTDDSVDRVFKELEYLQRKLNEWTAAQVAESEAAELGARMAGQLANVMRRRSATRVKADRVDRSDD
jgi:hypothetical protein